MQLVSYCQHQLLAMSLLPFCCAQPAEAPSLDTGVVATNVAPSMGPSVLGVDDAVSALAEAIDWGHLRPAALPGELPAWLHGEFRGFCLWPYSYEQEGGVYVLGGFDKAGRKYFLSLAQT